MYRLELWAQLLYISSISHCRYLLLSKQIIDQTLVPSLWRFAKTTKHCRRHYEYPKANGNYLHQNQLSSGEETPGKPLKRQRPAGWHSVGFGPRKMSWQLAKLARKCDEGAASFALIFDKWATQIGAQCRRREMADCRSYIWCDYVLCAQFPVPLLLMNQIPERS